MEVTAWTLFADWCTATGRDPLATTEETLEAFWRAVPVATSTRGQREKAIRAALLPQGVLIPTEKAIRPSAWRTGPAWADLERTLGAIPFVGWPGGFRGRRDAYLAVLIHQGYTREEAREVRPGDIAWIAPGSIRIGRCDIPTAVEPEECAACAVARWLRAVALTDWHGRGLLRETLVRQQGRVVGHVCRSDDAGEWRGVHWTLTPAINRYGHVETGVAMSTRAISAVLAYRQAAPLLGLPGRYPRFSEATRDTEIFDDLDTTVPTRVERLAPADANLDELFDRIDEEFDAADAVMDRINAMTVEFEAEMRTLYGEDPDDDGEGEP